MIEKKSSTSSDGVSDAPIRLAITGRAGRMSARLRALAQADARFALSDHFGARDAETTIHDDLQQHDAPQVVVDFTGPAGARHALALARAANAGLLVGTTGLSREILDELGDFARSRPVMIAPNTSLGAAVLSHLVAITSRLLRGRCHIDIVDRHHIHKRDAPSGTARRLAETIRRAGVDLPDDRLHAIRAGAIIGEHEVAFTGPEEILKIFHQVTHRDVFVRGALDIAAWLPGRPAGSYVVEEFLGLPAPGP